MAEYLIQGETLANMADKIRVLNDVEGAMTPAQMDGNLGEVSVDVSTEADLIAQIASALEGKEAGSSGGGTIRVEVQNFSASPVYYWDVNGTLKNVAARTTEYVDALNGTLHYMQEMTTVCNGPPNTYMSNIVKGVYVAMFLVDNCTMTCHDIMS